MEGTAEVNGVNLWYRISGEGAAEIAAGIERGIAAGELRPGEALPSVRSLAAELGVSPTTVAAAFKSLRSRGLVVTRSRSGAQVSWRPPLGTSLLGASVPEGARDLAGGNPAGLVGEVRLEIQGPPLVGDE